MTTLDNQRVYLDDLCKRWQKSADQIIEMAIGGKVVLWIGFSNVIVEKKSNTDKKKKTARPQLHELLEVQPQAEVLALLQYRCDRMLVGAEFPCLDAGNKPVVVSNSVGDEWGEVSMIGLQPGRLFVRLDDVIRFESKHRIVPHTTSPHRIEQQRSISSEVNPASPKEHPCFAVELHIANTCWLALFSGKEQADSNVDKADILAWLQRHHPELSKAATGRIAQVATPNKGRCR